MKHKIFNNGVTGVTDNRVPNGYAIIAIPKGFIMVPKCTEPGKKIILSYKEISEDIFITNKDELINKICEFIVEQTGEQQRILVSWNEDVDLAIDDMSDILMEHKKTTDQFDRE